MNKSVDNIAVKVKLISVDWKLLSYPKLLSRADIP